MNIILLGFVIVWAVIILAGFMMDEVDRRRKR